MVALISGANARSVPPDYCSHCASTDLSLATDVLAFIFKSIFMKFHTVHFSHTNLTVKLMFYLFYQLFPVWSHDEDVMKPKGNCGRSESGFTKMLQPGLQC